MTIAVVREVDGQLVLDDPYALALLEGIEQHNRHRAVKAMLALNAERILHFRRRIREIGRSAADAVILVLDGNDPIGAIIAMAVMPPGWDLPFRGKGGTPVARGLAERAGIQAMLDDCKPDAGKDLRAVAGVACIVVHADTLAVLDLGAL